VHAGVGMRIEPITSNQNAAATRTPLATKKAEASLSPLLLDCVFAVDVEKSLYRFRLLALILPAENV
jgi:hypothetical protein